LIMLGTHCIHKGTCCAHKGPVTTHLPTAPRSLPSAEVLPVKPHPATAPSTSPKNISLFRTLVPPRTTRTPGVPALIEAVILASSYVAPPTMNTIISCGLSRVVPPPSTNGYNASLRRPLIRSCKVPSRRGECWV